MAISKLELEKVIKNGESVYAVFYSKTFDFVNYRGVFELHPDNTVTEYGSNIEYAIGFWEFHRGADVIDMRFYKTDDEFCILLSRVHKSAKAAEHWAFHKDITRTETLPFLTWEEFKEQKFFKFNSADNIDCMLQLVDNGRKIALIAHTVKYFKATEENFYKAYDECVRLFRDVE